MSFWYRSGACSNNGPSYREGRIGPRVGLGALLLACAVGAVARAQERQPPGMVVTLDVEQRLEYSDNPDLEVDGDADFYGRTGFGPVSEADLPAPRPLQQPQGWLAQSLTDAPLTPLQGPAACVAAFDDPRLW